MNIEMINFLSGEERVVITQQRRVFFDAQNEADRQKQLTHLENLCMSTCGVIKHLHWPYFSNGNDGLDLPAVETAPRSAESGGSGVHVARLVHDAFFLQIGNAAAFVTRDCPIVVLTHPDGGPVLTVHASRQVLERECLSSALIYARKRRHWKSLEDLYAYVSFGICPGCFRHDTHPSFNIDAVLDAWGSDVVPNPELGTLDLKHWIRLQLELFGIRDIQVDRSCTGCDPTASSKRAHDAGMPNKDGHNLVFVAYPSARTSDAN